GWVRVDPPGVVVPERIEQGALEIARQAGRPLPGSDLAWLRSLHYNWEALQNSWNQWVISYSQERQRALVERFGLAPSLENVSLVLALVVSVMFGWLAWVSMRPRTGRDPLGASFQVLRDRLEQAGVAAAVSCGPRELYVRTKRVLIDEDVKTAKRLLSRYERLRYGRASETATRKELRALRG